MRNDYKSFCIDDNPPIKRNENMYLIEAQNHVLSCQREDSDFMNNKNHCFQQRQRMAIVCTYEHAFGNSHPNEWK